MLDKSTGFVRLPGEKVLLTTPRTTLELNPPNPYPGKEPMSIYCSNGRAYLTNQRVLHAIGRHRELQADLRDLP